MAERIVQPVHGAGRQVVADPSGEREMADRFRSRSLEERVEQFARYRNGEGWLDQILRRVLLRSLVRSMGDGVVVSPGVWLKHPETLELGDNVFLGAGAQIQGRFDGACRIGSGTWIGPGAYFDARDLELGESVGWGPGAKVLGSEHLADDLTVPVIATGLRIRPVRVLDGADVGTNAVILPGVTVGRGAIVGAGAVVREDVPDFAVVAGVPAKFLRWRDGRQTPGEAT